MVHGSSNGEVSFVRSLISHVLVVVVVVVLSWLRLMDPNKKNAVNCMPYIIRAVYELFRSLLFLTNTPFDLTLTKPGHFWFLDIVSSRCCVCHAHFHKK